MTEKATPILAMLPLQFGWFDGAYEFRKEEFHPGAADPVTKGVSFVISVKNLSDKVIKYITFNFSGYDAVGEKVGSGTFKCAGPLNPGQILSEGIIHNCFYAPATRSAELDHCIIDFMDGSREVVGGLKYLSYKKEFLISVQMSVPEADAVSYIKVVQSFYSGSGNASASGGCYVATAVYGSYDCPSVWTLRRFRDERLATTWRGRQFISLYYAISPTIVRLFGKNPYFCRYWRKKLDRLVANLRAQGVSDEPYHDKGRR